MDYQFILSRDFEIVKFKNRISIIFVENVGQDIEQHCLEEDYIDELYDYYSDYDYPHD